jgi:hypothetical protein
MDGWMDDPFFFSFFLPSFLPSFKPKPLSSQANNATGRMKQAAGMPDGLQLHAMRACANWRAGQEASWQVPAAR